MAPVYALLLLLLGAIFAGTGILLILLASSAGGSIAVIWTIFLHAVAFLWPTLCNGYSVHEYMDEFSTMSDLDGVVARKTRVWVFIIISLLIVCQGSSIWIAIDVYGGSKVPDTWPGVALGLCVFMQTVSGLLFFAAR